MASLLCLYCLASFVTQSPCYLRCILPLLKDTSFILQECEPSPLDSSLSQSQQKLDVRALAKLQEESM